MRRSSVLRAAGIVFLTVGAAAAVGTLVVRDQMSRHQRNLFSPNALKRFAALGYVSGLDASVALVHVLRDFVAWEQSSLLRKRASQILQRMDSQLEKRFATSGAAG
jgi:hypothetical protein